MGLPVYLPKMGECFQGGKRVFFYAILYGDTEMTHCSGECEFLPVFVTTLSVLSAEICFVFLRMKMRINQMLKKKLRMKRRSRKRKGKQSLDDALAKRKCMSIFVFCEPCKLFKTIVVEVGNYCLMNIFHLM